MKKLAVSIWSVLFLATIVLSFVAPKEAEAGECFVAIQRTVCEDHEWVICREWCCWESGYYICFEEECEETGVYCF